MLPEVAEHVERLAEALKETPQYERMAEAQRDVESREAARIMMRDYQRLLGEMEQKRLAGEMTEDDIRRWEQQLEIIGMNPYVRELLDAQGAFGALLIEVQSRLMQALGLQGPGADDDEGDDGGDGVPPVPGGGSPSASEQPRIVKPAPKLWTPGS